MSELHTLLTDLALGESPRWHAGRLWLSDWVAHEIIAVDLAGKREVITTIPSLPFCIDFLPGGRLLVIAEQQLLCREPDGSLVTYADLMGCSAYPWNELVVDARGNAYINNIGFDFPGCSWSSLRGAALRAWGADNEPARCSAWRHPHRAPGGLHTETSAAEFTFHVSRFTDAD